MCESVFEADEDLLGISNLSYFMGTEGRPRLTKPFLFYNSHSNAAGLGSAGIIVTDWLAATAAVHSRPLRLRGGRESPFWANIYIVFLPLRQLRKPDFRAILPKRSYFGGNERDAKL